MFHSITPAGWMSRNDIVDFGLGCSQNALTRWRLEGCPLLGGRKLGSKADPLRPHAVLYRCADLEQIKLALAPLPEEFDGWIWSNAAATKFGISTPMLRLYAREGHPSIASKKLGCTTRHGSTNGVQVHERTYYRRDQLERIAAAKAREPDASWITVPEAASLGVSYFLLAKWTRRAPGGGRVQTRRGGRGGRATLYRRADVQSALKARKAGAAAGWLTWRSVEDEFGFPLPTLVRWRDGCNYLDGRALKARRELVANDRGSTQQQWVYWRKDLQQIAATMRDAHAVYRDDQGEWLPERLACERYATNKGMIRAWHLRRVPKYAHQPLRRQKVRMGLRRNPNGLACWVYLDSDLRRLIALKNGTPMDSTPAAFSPAQRRSNVQGQPLTDDAWEFRQSLLEAWKRAKPSYRECGGLAKFCAERGVLVKTFHRYQSAAKMKQNRSKEAF